MSLKGVPKSAEHRENIRLARLGTKASDATKAKMSLTRRGRSVSQETKAKMSAALLGRAKSETHKASMRAAMRDRPGRVWTDEQKAAMSALRKGKPLSSAHREKLSKAKARRPSSWTKRKIPYGSVKFRSTYEVRAAKAFDALGIPWEYETRCFRLSPTQSYRPDFILTDGIWEVKGYMDEKSQVKLAAFRRLYPDIPLVVASLQVIEMLEHAATHRKGER